MANDKRSGKDDRFYKRERLSTGNRTYLSIDERSFDADYNYAIIVTSMIDLLTQG